MSVLPSADEKAAYVQSMFSAIAGRYDTMNRLMTFGLDQGWRRYATRLVATPNARLVLDIGSGTGDFLPILQQAMPKAQVIGLDYTLAMMVAGQAKRDVDTPRGSFVNGDALSLPFADGACDVVTTGFMMRNVVDIAQAFREMARITKPGGRLVCLEVARPEWALVRFGHQIYFNHVVPRIGALIGGNSRAYTYLPQSAGVFPQPDELAQIIGDAGWEQVEWKRLGFGAVAIHSATRA